MVSKAHPLRDLHDRRLGWRDVLGGRLHGALCSLAMKGDVAKGCRGGRDPRRWEMWKRWVGFNKFWVVRGLISWLFFVDGFGWCDFFFSKNERLPKLLDPNLHTDLCFMSAFGGGYLATPITRPYPILPNWWLSAYKKITFFWKPCDMSRANMLVLITTLWLCALRWSLTVDSFLHAPWCTSRFHILPLLAKYRNIRQKSPKMIFLWTSIILVSLLTPCLDFTAGCSGST